MLQALEIEGEAAKRLEVSAEWEGRTRTAPWESLSWLECWAFCSALAVRSSGDIESSFPCFFCSFLLRLSSNSAYPAFSWLDPCRLFAFVLFFVCVRHLHFRNEEHLNFLLNECNRNFLKCACIDFIFMIFLVCFWKTNFFQFENIKKFEFNSISDSSWSIFVQIVHGEKAFGCVIIKYYAVRQNVPLKVDTVIILVGNNK